MKPKNVFAKQSLGQNFLVDTAVVERIIAAFDPRSDDVVLEIGPGRGALTERLLERAGRVYALEFDRDLAPILREQFADHANFTLIEGDALEIDIADIDRGGRKLRLIANLPYNISTAILQRLFLSIDVLQDCVLMFQREVVERITAQPGNSDRGYLTVMIEAHFTVERLFDVPPDAFRPRPKVWSSVARLVPNRAPIVDREFFERVVSSGFLQKRKTILNNLKTGFPTVGAILETAAIDSRRRAETLTLDEWMRLSDALRSA